MAKSLVNKVISKFNRKNKSVKQTKTKKQELIKEELEQRIKANALAYEAEKRTMTALEFQDAINTELWLNGQGG